MALACMVSFTAFSIYLWRGRFRGKDVLFLVIVAICLMAMMVLVDSMLVRRGSASHIGLFVASLREQGLSVFTETIVRKLSVSFSLLRTISVWTAMVLGGSVLLLLLVIHRSTQLQEALRHRPWLSAGIVSVAIGTVAALLLEDSGLLAIAFSLLYAAGSLGYVALGADAPRRRRRNCLVPETTKHPLRAD